VGGSKRGEGVAMGEEGDPAPLNVASMLERPDMSRLVSTGLALDCPCMGPPVRYAQGSVGLLDEGC